MLRLEAGAILRSQAPEPDQLRVEPCLLLGRVDLEQDEQPLLRARRDRMAASPGFGELPRRREDLLVLGCQLGDRGERSAPAVVTHGEQPSQAWTLF